MTIHAKLWSVLVLLLLPAVLLTGCTNTPTTPTATPESPTADTPAEQVNQFYNDWISYPGNPVQGRRYDDPDRLTAEFIQRLDNTIARGNLRVDPILCAQNKPTSITIGDTTTNADTASVIVQTNLATGPDSATTHNVQVELVQQDGQWLIADVICPGVAVTPPITTPEPAPTQPAAPTSPPPAATPDGALVGPEWSVAYAGDLNNDGTRDVVAYQPTTVEPAASMQSYVTADTFVAAELIVVQANAAGEPVIQFAADPEGLKSNGANINPFRPDLDLTPAAFIVEVMPANAVKLAVLPINAAGEGFTQAAPITWNPAEQRYALTGPGMLPSETQAPDEMEIVLYWAVGEELQPEYRRIPRTEAVGTATLELLLAGPPHRGLNTAIPTPDEVQTYSGRQPDWGDRVRLLGLTIEDGVATANFSQEMRAYGGGSARVQQIRQQITQTLLQFPTVDEVRIAVEGEVATALQP
jgi:spore germination protein GerM